MHRVEIIVQERHICWIKSESWWWGDTNSGPQNALVFFYFDIITKLHLKRSLHFKPIPFSFHAEMELIYFIFTPNTCFWLRFVFFFLRSHKALENLANSCRLIVRRYHTTLRSFCIAPKFEISYLLSVILEQCQAISAHLFGVFTSLTDDCLQWQCKLEESPQSSWKVYKDYICTQSPVVEQCTRGAEMRKARGSFIL